MDPIVTYLIHAIRNATNARDWPHLDTLVTELHDQLSLNADIERYLSGPIGLSHSGPR